MAERMDRIQFYLEPELNAALDQLAEKLGTSKAELIRRGVRKIVGEQAAAVRDPALDLVGLLGGEGKAVTDWATRHDELIYRRDWEPSE